MDGDNRIDVALRGYAQRVSGELDERKKLNTRITGIYAEAKEAGFDTTILREIVRELRMEPDARASRYQLLNEYRASLGMLDGTPLGDASVHQFEQDAPRRGRGRPRTRDFDA